MSLHPMPGVPRDTTRRIGLLGGSFNPAHPGHRHISLEAMKRLGLDEIWWLVSPQNPLKSGDGMEAAADTRRPRPAGRRPSAHPRRRPPNCCWAHVTRSIRYGALRRIYPKARFVWLMGADILPQLVDWAGWRDLFATIPIAAFARPGWGYAALAATAPRTFARHGSTRENARQLASCEPPAWCFIPSRLDSHSATAIRAVRPRRTRTKGKTISDQNSSAGTRQLPDRRKAIDALLTLVRRSLEDDKAEDVVVIDLKGKSAFADYMVIASGRSNRQVVAIADHLAEKLKAKRPWLHAGRRQAGRRLGPRRCRRRGRPYLPPRTPRLLRAGENVGAGERGRGQACEGQARQEGTHGETQGGQAAGPA
jgi:nicotinic acid mononucleotide adenylyltransferase